MTRLVIIGLLALGAAACAIGPSGPGAGTPEITQDSAPADDRGVAFAAGLELPATFAGTLPCADCPGVRHRLNLWPDGVFHLQRTWLARGGSASDIGRWRKDPARDAILLHRARGMPLQFSVEGPRTLRRLDAQGGFIESELPYELTSDGSLTPLELDLSLRGMFTYLADAPRLEECLTGRSYPVAMEGDYIALERAYLATEKPAPGAPILAAFDGRLTERPAMEGSRNIPTVVVERHVGLFPDQSCERAMSEASLPNTYWRLVRLGSVPVPAVEGRREPHIVLRLQDDRYAATVGCNQLVGTWEVQGDGISFRPTASTRMACPPPLAEREKALADKLTDARRWEINGQVLELFDETGESIAVLEAVYLP